MILSCFTKLKDDLVFGGFPSFCGGGKSYDPMDRKLLRFITQKDEKRNWYVPKTECAVFLFCALLQRDGKTFFESFFYKNKTFSKILFVPFYCFQLSIPQSFFFLHHWILLVMDMRQLPHRMWFLLCLNASFRRDYYCTFFLKDGFLQTIFSTHLSFCWVLWNWRHCYNLGTGREMVYHPSVELIFLLFTKRNESQKCGD